MPGVTMTSVIESGSIFSIGSLYALTFIFSAFSKASSMVPTM